MLLSGSWRSLHLWVLLAHGGGIVLHHLVPVLKCLARLHVGVFEIVCHQTRHVVHGFVDLVRSVSVHILRVVRLMADLKVMLQRGRYAQVGYASTEQLGQRQVRFGWFEWVALFVLGRVLVHAR